MIEMTESVLFLTSRNGTELDDLIRTAIMISDSGSHVRVLLIGNAVIAAVKGSVPQKQFSVSRHQWSFSSAKRILNHEG